MAKSRNCSAEGDAALLYLIVFLGAGIGGALRHGVNVLAPRLFGHAFPYATLGVNVVGSFLLGIVAGYAIARPGVSQEMRLFLATGILGGFTTFSAFSLDAALLIERQAYALAAGYVLGSVGLSLLALFAGLGLSRFGAALP